MKSFEEKYVELSCLGQGGFGSVYAGLRKDDNLPVAIKHIPIEMVTYTPVTLRGELRQLPLEVVLLLVVGQCAADMAETARREEASGEARSAVGGAGQAAVELLNWYELDQELLIVMERPVPAVDLFHYMQDRGGYLPEDQAKIILRQVVEALVNFHSWGVLHRDIKPENLLVETGSAVPRIRVLDFGCGTIIQEEPYTKFAGTRLYTPPEWYLHGSYQAGPSAVWQLGVLFYNVVTGAFPFRTPNQLICGEPVMDGISSQCEDLINLCLAKCPKDRPTLQQVLLHPWLQPEERKARSHRKRTRQERGDAESSGGGQIKRKRVLEERQDSGTSVTAPSLEDPSFSPSLSLCQGNSKSCRVDPRSPEVSTANTTATRTSHGTDGRVGCCKDYGPEVMQGCTKKETECGRACAVSTCPAMVVTALLPRGPLTALPNTQSSAPPEPPAESLSTPAPPELSAHEQPGHGHQHRSSKHHFTEHLFKSRRSPGLRPGLPPELPRLFTLPPGRPPELPWPSALPPGRPPDLPLPSSPTLSPSPLSLLTIIVPTYPTTHTYRHTHIQTHTHTYLYPPPQLHSGERRISP